MTRSRRASVDPAPASHNKCVIATIFVSACLSIQLQSQRSHRLSGQDICRRSSPNESESTLACSIILIKRIGDAGAQFFKMRADDAVVSVIQRSIKQLIKFAQLHARQTGQV